MRPCLEQVLLLLLFTLVVGCHGLICLGIVVRSERIRSYGTLQTLDCFAMMTLAPQKARMFNSRGVIAKLRRMENSIESLVCEATFARQSGTYQPSRCDIDLLKIASRK